MWIEGGGFTWHTKQQYWSGISRHFGEGCTRTIWGSTEHSLPAWPLLNFYPKIPFFPATVSCPVPFRWQLLKSFLWYNLISFGLYFKMSLIKRSLICSGRSQCGSYASLGYPPNPKTLSKDSCKTHTSLKGGCGGAGGGGTTEKSFSCGSLPSPQDCRSVCFRSVWDVVTKWGWARPKGTATTSQGLTASG